MENQYKIFFLLFIAILSFSLLFIIFRRKCKSHCTGLTCGSESDNGCGEPCQCNSGGICVKGICKYKNCDGIRCGSDGLGGSCDCKALPNGICQNGKCCYRQDHNGYYCGPDGCGDTASCLTGATCSNTNAPGICFNSGSLGWKFNILQSKGTSRKNVSSPEECSKWIPKNIFLDLQNFPCNSGKDCPEGESCINGYCDKNNIFQYWHYDPTDESGYNCTKIVAGSVVCGIEKEGASGFDVIGNTSPSVNKCGNTCIVKSLCPQAGIGSCCPEDWININSAYCKDLSGQGKCCLNNPEYNDYNSCISSGLPSCDKVNTWGKANIGEIDNGICGVSLTGQNISINKDILKAKDSFFKNPCENKYSSDSCIYNDGSTTYTGLCQMGDDRTLRCLPETICMAVYNNSSQPGVCRSPNF